MFVHWTVFEGIVFKSLFYLLDNLTKYLSIESYLAIFKENQDWCVRNIVWNKSMLKNAAADIRNKDLMKFMKINQVFGSILYSSLGWQKDSFKLPHLTSKRKHTIDWYNVFLRITIAKIQNKGVQKQTSFNKCWKENKSRPRLSTN